MRARAVCVDDAHAETDKRLQAISASGEAAELKGHRARAIKDGVVARLAEKMTVHKYAYPTIRSENPAPAQDESVASPSTTGKHSTLYDSPEPR